MRKRETHVLQNVGTNRLKFIQRNEERPVEPKQTKLEHILVEVIEDLLIEGLGEAADSDVCKVFNNIVSIADSAKEINVPISNKTERSITRKIKSIKDQAVLFRQFYLSQVAKNLSENDLFVILKEKLNGLDQQQNKTLGPFCYDYLWHCFHTTKLFCQKILG